MSAPALPPDLGGMAAPGALPADLAGAGAFTPNGRVSIFRRDGVTPGPQGVDALFPTPARDRFTASGQERETMVTLPAGTDVRDGDQMQILYVSGVTYDASARKLKVATAIPQGDGTTNSIAAYIVGFKL